MNRDEKYMKRALALAARAKGATSPNPMVGAVVARGERIIAEGHHRRAGEDHAEVVALRNAGADAKGAELFLNLEPCFHQGRTPPCTPRVIESGVKRVVAGMTDPNPKTAGRGIEAMRRAGIEVRVGVLEDECRRLNEAFIHWVTTGKPFCILKVAMSLDGKIATRAGHSQWITGEKSRRDVHRLRAQVDAVIVGAGTVRADDPSLTARDVKVPKQPRPVILSPELKLPDKARVYDHPAGCIIATGSKATAGRRKALEKRGVEIIKLPTAKGLIQWKPLMEKLGEFSMSSVLIEGGGRTFGTAIDSHEVKKVVAYVAPIIIGGAGAPGAFGGKGASLLEDAARMRDIQIRKMGDDIRIEGYL